MYRDELRHLEHVHHILAAEDLLEVRISDDIALVLRVLEILSLDVDPELLNDFRAGHRALSYYRREIGAHRERFHEGGILFCHTIMKISN